MASQLSFVLLASWFAFVFALQPMGTNISLDSTLHPTVTPTTWLFPSEDSTLRPTVAPSSWPSPSGHFAFGFYLQGSGYSVGAWLVTPGNITVIWTAFRDNPPFPESVSLKLTNQGLMLLNTISGDQLISDNSSTTVSASMLDSGNFIIYGTKNETLWQTFDNPTDTIMPGQILTQGTSLFSSVSETNHSIGQSRLVMQSDGNLVMYPAYTDDDFVDAYFASNTYGNKDFTNCSLNLDADGHLYLLGNNGTYDLTGVQGNSTLKTYLARLDSDGIFRLYSYKFAEQAAPLVLAIFPNLTDPCQNKAACGLNSYCTSDNAQLECLCLPGFHYADPQDKSYGCTKNFTSTCPSRPGENATMISLQSMEWIEDPYSVPSSINTLSECIDACQKDCICDVVLFYSGACRKQRFPVKRARQVTGLLTTASIKTVTVTGGRLPPDPAPVVVQPKISRKVVSTKVRILIVVFLSIVIVVFVLCVLACRYRHTRIQKSSTFEETLALPRWFSYEELSEATGEFKEKLGEGSFGTVFKGALVLAGGVQTAVAVKRLEKMVEEGEREFQTEMKAIGRIHHKNLVRLLGFCAEGSNRLLVYELMSNGSLADIIFNPVIAERPHWSERVRILLDVARGINYLHEDCETCIIHCDIKPQNILMDGNWTAKISDFGMAKLLMPNQTRTFTQMRGTRGYLAPEWAKNAPISVKADVYSFGIVLLETLCCRRGMELTAQSDEIMLVDWVYNCFIEGELKILVSVEEDTDARELERLVNVGLWCIQHKPSLRPYMKNVVMMLEGNAPVPFPPSPASDP